MFKISLTSRLLDVLGRTFIGTPEALVMPPDFFYIPGDRERGTTEDYKDTAFVRRRIAINHFRRNLFVHVYRVATVISAMLCLVLFAALLAVGAVKGGDESGQLESSSAQHANCERLRPYHDAGKLPPDVDARFLNDCNR